MYVCQSVLIIILLLWNKVSSSNGTGITESKILGTTLLSDFHEIHSITLNHCNAPINVKPHYPPCGQHRGICGDLHFRFIKSPPTGRVQKIQSPANRQVELTILEKNVAKLYLCGRRSPNTEAQRFIELPDKI